MKTFAAAAAMAIVLSVPAAAKTVLNNPQRVVPDYAASGVRAFQICTLRNGQRGIRQSKRTS